MTRQQRQKYEMFVRVRNFGLVTRDVFPESSTGGLAFTMVAEAVAALEEHLSRLAVARAEARRIRTTTRRAVADAMRVLTTTGRRVAAAEPGNHPFRMPRQQSAAVVLATARMLLEQAEQRQDGFARLGIPPAFLADFRRKVGDLELAINIQRDSRPSRQKAQAGLETAVARGVEGLRDLDVVVPNAMSDDPVRLAQWEGARHLPSRSSASRVVTTTVAPLPSDLPAVSPPSAETASPPSGPAADTSPFQVHPLEKAS